MLSVSGATLSASYLLSPNPPNKGKETKREDTKGRNSSSTVPGRTPTTLHAASRSPTLMARPITLPNFHAFFLEVLGAPLSVADSKPAAAQFIPHRGFIHPLTNLVVVVCRLPGVDRRCERCQPIVVVRGVPSAER